MLQVDLAKNAKTISSLSFSVFFLSEVVAVIYGQALTLYLTSLVKIESMKVDETIEEYGAEWRANNNLQGSRSAQVIDFAFQFIQPSNCTKSDAAEEGRRMLPLRSVTF